MVGEHFHMAECDRARGPFQVVRGAEGRGQQPPPLARLRLFFEREKRTRERLAMLRQLDLKGRQQLSLSALV